MAKWFARWRRRGAAQDDAARALEDELQKETSADTTEEVDPPGSSERDVEAVQEAEPVDDDIVEGEPEPEPESAPVTSVATVPVSEVLSDSNEVDGGKPGDGPSEPAAEPKKRGMFARLREGLSRTRAGMSERIVQLVTGRSAISEELYEELEEVLIQADVGVPTTLRIVEGVRSRVEASRIKDPSMLTALVAEEMREILSVGSSELALPEKGAPKLYMVVGVNGAGKTTTIGKLAARFKAEGKRVILGAGDTFRAAAIDQLAVWAERAGVELIKHQEGSDPAAVAYDAVQAAKAREADILILDTAGRLQNKVNLMRELSKVYRVLEREWGSPPDETLLVVDANTGQNGLSQARQFMEATPLTGVVLTKLDSTSKGGIVLAIASEIGLPVKLIGVGEAIDDLRDFDADDFVKALFPGLPSESPDAD